ncbi:hypothetical protein GCM10009733_020940 [Nonomuraea maheshkhaliensis]|uniref:ParB/Sulfiredoxin domain-containing protein n=1 Tax=Nonomuraea maheshkhaliensis TaxID=419590 RepID=A0ABP4QVI3_9ACTN
MTVIITTEPETETDHDQLGCPPDTAAVDLPAELDSGKAGDDEADNGNDDDLSGPDYPPFAWIPDKRLRPHPRNVREDDLDLTDAFCRSLEAGIKQALLVFPDPDGSGAFIVEDGNRRLLGSRKRGVTREFPCMIDPALADNVADQFTDMITTAVQRKDLTALQQSMALFSAEEAGGKVRDIAAKTGLTQKDVKRGMTAGKMVRNKRDALIKIKPESDWTLLEMGQMAEFADDEAATEYITSRAHRGTSVQHAIAFLKEERQLEADRAKLKAELEAAGVAVTDDLPDGAVHLYSLPAKNGKSIDKQAHANCPGRGAYFTYRTNLSHYCAQPDQHGYKPHSEQKRTRDKNALPVKVVKEGNTAWKACTQLRQDFIKSALSRKTDPDQQVLRFVCAQVAKDMPHEVRAKYVQGSSLGSRNHMIGAPPTAEQIAAAKPGRLAWLFLAPLAAAYEETISSTKTSPSYVWRTDRQGAITREQTAVWLQFLISLGYEPSLLEKTVVSKVPYKGEHAGDDALVDDKTEPALESDAGSDADRGHAEPDEAEPDEGSREAEDEDDVGDGARSVPRALSDDADTWADPESDAVMGEFADA